MLYALSGEKLLLFAFGHMGSRGRRWRYYERRSGQNGYFGPEQIVNTHLNVVGLLLIAP